MKKHVKKKPYTDLVPGDVILAPFWKGCWRRGMALVLSARHGVPGQPNGELVHITLLIIDREFRFLVAITRTDTDGNVRIIS